LSGGFVDLLCINAEGHIHAIELKRDRAPREVVAQALDYGSWVVDLSYDQIEAIFASRSQGQTFEQAFTEFFGVPVPDTINEQHRLTIVASELDDRTERIITYVSSFGVPVNVVFFRYFEDDGREYLMRTWLIEPADLESQATRAPRQRSGSGPAWNGRDFYIALGDGDHRSWEDCRRYGFISAGQGPVYSRPLKNLRPGHRVFVYIPGAGYVRVGIVSTEAKPVRDFRVTLNGTAQPLLQCDLIATDMDKNADDPEYSEHVVGVDWIKTLPRGEAVRERGLFANQMTACRLRDPHTLERLTEIFDLEEE
jgi:hypothetical protein